MEIRQIYYVMEIAKQKSFSRAAKALFITQPAISQQVSALENELQTKLFQRDTHKVTLTKDGERFCEYGAKVLDSVNDLLGVFGQNGSDHKTVLNVGVFPFYRVTGLAQKIAGFFVTNANVVGSLKVLENYMAFEQVENGELDFAVIKVLRDTIPSSVKYEFLAEESLYAIMDEKLWHMDRDYVAVQELGTLPLLTGEKGSSLYDYMKNLYEANQVDFNVAFFNTKEVGLMTEMLASGTGMLLASESVAKQLARDHVRAYRIVPEEKLWIILVYQKKRRLQGLEIAFRDYIVHYFRDTADTMEELIVEEME